MKDLGKFGGTNGPLGPNSVVSAFNNRGQVVGGMFLPGEQFVHAFLWNGEQLSDLGHVLKGDVATAKGINDAGEVIGWVGFQGGLVKHRILWRDVWMMALSTIEVHQCGFANKI